MRSPVVYRLAREAWGPLLAGEGFLRLPKSSCAWYKAHDDHFLLVSVHVDHHGWDRFRGSDFVVEFEAADRLVLGATSHDNRGRLGERLDEAELRRILVTQNEVIGRLRRPLPSELGMEDDDPDAQEYLRLFFDAQQEQYRNDLHFRYHDERDVAEWLRLLAPKVLPELTRFHEAWLQRRHSPSR